MAVAGAGAAKASHRILVMKAAIAYIGVSTAKQGKSGLGLEAQQEALARFAEAEGLYEAPQVKSVFGGVLPIGQLPLPRSSCLRLSAFMA